MFGYFGELQLAARRRTNAINTKASIDISPRLILELLWSLLLLLGLGIPIFNITLERYPGV